MTRDGLGGGNVPLRMDAKIKWLVWWDTTGSVQGEIQPPSADPLPR